MQGANVRTIAVRRGTAVVPALVAQLAALAAVAWSGTAYADLFRWHGPPAGFSVLETITSADANDWQYSYSIHNADTSAIYMFAVYTDFNVILGSGTWSKAGWWTSYHNDMPASTYDEYVPFNREPDNKAMTLGFDGGSGSPSNIQPGETVAAFAFRADTYDPSRKLWMYEAGSNWAPETGKVSCYGYSSSVPEPSSCALLALAAGGIGAMLRKRGKR